MSAGITVGYRVWHSRRHPATGAYGNWVDSDLLLPQVAVDCAAGGASDGAVNWPTAKVELNLPAAGIHAWQWRQVVSPDDQIAVVSDDTDPAVRAVLFAGFIVDADWGFAADEGCILTANGYAFRLARDAAHLVYGRYMASKAAAVTHYSAIPLSFNADGEGNLVSGTYQAPGVGAAKPVVTPYFAADGAWGAPRWRALEAVEYLLWNYNADQTWLSNPVFGLAQRLASPEIELEIPDGTSLWAALAMVADAGGCDLHQTLAIDAEGEISAAIALTRRGEGVECVLDHQAPEADGSYPALDAEQTNLFAGRFAETTASCVTAPIVAGGRDVYEITVNLYEAWNATLGDEAVEMPAGASLIQPGQEQANSANLYVRRYCRGGDLFATYADVGRLWVANEDAAYSAVAGQVPDVAALAGEAAGSWPQMPYTAVPVLTSHGEAAVAGVKVSDYFLEFSIDGGANWYWTTSFAALPDRLGVCLTAPNLASIVPKGGAFGTDDLATKLIAAGNLVRLRLTCCVASPHRRLHAGVRQATAGTAFATAGWFERGPAVAARTRAASSSLVATGLTADEATGSDADATLTQAAWDLQDLNQDRFIEGSPVIEWVATEYPIGGRVTRIGGINVPLAANCGAAVRYPRIVRRTWRLSPDQYSTEFQLDTDRQAAVV